MLKPNTGFLWRAGLAIALAAALPPTDSARSASRDRHQPSGLANGSSKSFTLQFEQVKLRPIAFELHKGALFFEGRIGDRPVTVLLDNGASETAIDLNLARQLGIAFEARQQGDRSVRTWHGDLPLFHAKNVSFGVPNQVSTTMSMAAIDLEKASRAIGKKIDVVLGADVIHHSALLIDFDKRGLLLTASNAISSDGKSLAFEIPIVDDHSVAARINGIEFRLEIDLGSATTVSLKEVPWHKSRREDSAIAQFPVADLSGAVRYVRRLTGATIELGPTSITGPVASLESADEASINLVGGDGVIGLGYFQNYNVVFDIPAKRIILLPRMSRPSR